MDKRIEAEQYVKKGNEAYIIINVLVQIIWHRLKTGLLKWNKDYASAAMNFDEAGRVILLYQSSRILYIAKLYRLSKDFVNARKIYEKLIAVNEKLNE